jgi:hypothetical protein
MTEKLLGFMVEHHAEGIQALVLLYLKDSHHHILKKLHSLNSLILAVPYDPLPLQVFQTGLGHNLKNLELYFPQEDSLELTISPCPWTDEDISCVVTSCVHLESLTLSNCNNIRGSCFESFSKVSLRQLSLDRFLCVDPHNWQVLFKNLAQLKVLTLVFIWDPPAYLFSLIAAHCPKIQQLSISCISQLDFCLHPSIPSVPHPYYDYAFAQLESLAVHLCPQFNDASILELCKVPFNVSLKKLSLMTVSVTGVGLIRLIDISPNLVEIRLEKCQEIYIQQQEGVPPDESNKRTYIGVPQSG